VAAAVSDGTNNGNELNVEQFAYLKTESNSGLGLHDTNEPFSPEFDVVCEINLPL
jgi:hypothetical protein